MQYAVYKVSKLFAINDDNDIGRYLSKGLGRYIYMVKW